MTVITSAKKTENPFKRNAFKNLGNWKMYILVLLFVLGMIIGVLCVGQGSQSDSILNSIFGIFENFKTIRSTQSMFATFCNSLFTSIFFTALIFTFGLCAIGTPIICSLPFIRGVYVGLISGYLYSSQHLTGLGYCLLIVFPGTLISVFVMLICCNESIAMSSNVMGLLNRKSVISSNETLKLYCVKYLGYCAFMLGAALIDAFLTKAFSSFFIS